MAIGLWNFIGGFCAGVGVAILLTVAFLAGFKIFKLKHIASREASLRSKKKRQEESREMQSLTSPEGADRRSSDNYGRHSQGSESYDGTGDPGVLDALGRMTGGQSDGSAAADALAAELRSDIAIDSTVFQKKWGDLEKSHFIDQQLDRVPELTILEQKLYDGKMFVIASGVLEGTSKYYFYAMDKAASAYLVELVIDPHASCRYTAKLEDMSQFRGFASLVKRIVETAAAETLSAV